MGAVRVTLLPEADAAQLADHLRDALELNTYHDSWGRMAKRVLEALEPEKYTVTMKGGSAGTADRPGEPGYIRISRADAGYPAAPAGIPTEFKFAIPIEPGKCYLISLNSAITVEQADEMRRRLAELFPGATFGFIAGAEVITELLEALTAAGNKLQLKFLNARDDQTKQSYYAAMVALGSLKDALTPQRDGAGTTPSEEPPTEPAPSQDPELARCVSRQPWEPRLQCVNVATPGDTFCNSQHRAGPERFYSWG